MEKFSTEQDCDTRRVEARQLQVEDARSRRVQGRASVVIGLIALAAAACDGRASEEHALLGSGAQTLKLDPSFENSNDPTDTAQPAGDYTLFEADPVRPVAILEESGLVAVANGVDDYLDLVKVSAGGKLSVCGGTRVGLRPVAVAVVEETRGKAELWVVNHLSDSLSVVEVDTEQCSATLVDTLYVGDEPRDIVVAASRQGGGNSVFVAAASRSTPSAGVRAHGAGSHHSRCRKAAARAG